ncbi:MAG: biopolymer transporter Tol [Verrucomicrobiota bacterium]
MAILVISLRMILALLAMGALFMPFLAAGQPVLVIEGDSAIPVAVGTIKGGQADLVKTVLTNDLNNSGSLKAVNSEKGVYQVSGSISGNTITGRLTDPSGKEVFAQRFTDNLRRAAHQFNDEVVLAITGKPGIATSRITFISSHSGKKEVYMTDIDGHNIRQLTSDKSISLGPKFSPSGDSIAYTSYKSGYPDVWVINLVLQKRRSVSFYPGINSAPAFSPDGAKLALTLSKDGNTELYTVNANGGSPNRLTNTRGTEASPTWSPSGKEIAFTSDDRGSPQIMILNRSSKSVRRMRTNSTYTTEPAWSPDGKSIAYSIMTAGQMQIGISNPLNGNQSILTTDGFCESPSWARNSRHLIYTRKGKIYLLDAVTKKTKPIALSISKCSEPHCSR